MYGHFNDKKSDDTHFMDMYGYFWASMNIFRDQWICIKRYLSISWILPWNCRVPHFGLPAVPFQDPDICQIHCNDAMNLGRGSGARRARHAWHHGRHEAVRNFIEPIDMVSSSHVNLVNAIRNIQTSTETHTSGGISSWPGTEHAGHAGHCRRLGESGEIFPHGRQTNKTSQQCFASESRVPFPSFSCGLVCALSFAPISFTSQSLGYSPCNRSKREVLQSH